MENIKVVTNYLKSDLVKKQRSFRLGLITIFLVVLFISILMNFIIISPIIFLKLSENQIGEGDLIMTPLLMQKDVVNKKGMLQTLIEETETKNKTNDSLKNNSISIDDILKDINIEGVIIERVENKENKNTNSTNDNTIVFDDNVLSNSALNDLSFQLLNFTEIENKLIPQSKSKLQDKFNSEINKNNDDDKIFSNHEAVGLTPRWIFYGNSSTNSKWAVSSMIILNSRKENFYNYGRNKVLKNLDFLECYISESVQKSLKINLEDNSYINININPITLLKTLGNGNKVEYDKVNFTTSEVEDKENSFNPDIPNDLFIRQKRVEVTDFPTVKIPDKLNKTKILRIEEKDDGYGNPEVIYLI